MSMRFWVAWPGAPLALASAALFGASTPLAKALLGEGLSPWLLAGLLYLGSGVGLAAFWTGHRVIDRSNKEAPLKRTDWGWMALIALSGGVIAPVLLMLGLVSTPASSAALLLNLEGLATMLIAWLVFRENVDRRLLLGALAILAGALLLSWRGDEEGYGWGSFAIAGACLAWGIDNNLTRKISGADPVQIAMVKGITAGSVNLFLAVGLGSQIPSAGLVTAAGVLGFFGYGISLVLFVLGLRYLGTARTGAYFSTAPFIGALIAVTLFDETVTPQFTAATALIAIGLWFHLSEKHSHEHVHEAISHSHAHVHDEHHQHPHAPGTPSNEPHVHHHIHTRLRHTHPHYPDLHHTHSH